MTRNVLIVFADDSLGGTSRSALLAGKAWRSQAYGVKFWPTKGIHPSRAEAFASIGSVESQIQNVEWRAIDVIHLHYSAWSPHFPSVVDALIAGVGNRADRVPLIVHNIFGEPETELHRWPGPRVSGLLGPWLLAQYLANQWPSRPLHPLAVVPNPQDLKFFHPPTVNEREAARRALSLHPDELVILRVGSPNRDKWSGDYLHLARQVESRHRMTLLCVGLPRDLMAKLQQFRCVRIEEMLQDDNELRNMYWASDCFALSAKQGESFGNVIIEALSTGLPVVYRGTPYRDNTPWSFRDQPGFTYTLGVSAWIDQVTHNFRPINHSMGTSLVEFSIEAVGEKLLGLSESLAQRGPELTTTLSIGVWNEVGLPNTLRIAVRHNRIAFALRRRLRRWRLQG